MSSRLPEIREATGSRLPEVTTNQITLQRSLLQGDRSLEQKTYTKDQANKIILAYTNSILFDTRANKPSEKELIANTELMKTYLETRIKGKPQTHEDMGDRLNYLPKWYAMSSSDKQKAMRLVEDVAQSISNK